MSEQIAYQHLPYIGFEKLLNLEGKTAIVTGGANGIGLAVSKRLCEAGAQVAMASLAEENSSEIMDAGYEAIFVKTNVTKKEDVKNLIQTTLDKYDKIDILVNCAGIYPLCPIHEIDEGFWDKVFSINIRATFFISQQVTSQMIKQGNGGCVVNLSSICAHRPMPNHCTYDSTKGAVVSMTRNMAYMLAEHGIRVNSISPGLTATPGNLEPELFKQLQDAGTLDHIPMHRPGEPYEIASAILFLCSPMASFVTGIDMKVDGGWSLYCI